MTNTVKDKPIIFSTPMVKAILDGRKIQTRRVIKNTAGCDKFYKMVTTLSGQPFYGVGLYKDSNVFLGDNGEQCIDAIYFKSRYEPGDLLWVREAWTLMEPTCNEGPPFVLYKADNPDCKNSSWFTKWKSPIFMPRKASRITLEVTGVRVEKLHSITEEDARAEGITDGGCINCGNPEPCGCDNPHPDAVDSFVWEWDKIYAKRGFGWIANPWVFVITFKRITP
jgi:hypothetical protein